MTPQPGYAPQLPQAQQMPSAGQSQAVAAPGPATAREAAAQFTGGQAPVAQAPQQAMIAPQAAQAQVAVTPQAQEATGPVATAFLTEASVATGPLAAAPAMAPPAEPPTVRVAPLSALAPTAAPQPPSVSALIETTPAGTAHRGRRAARKPRLAMSAVFADLVDMADIPRSAYAVDDEVTGAMCLFKTDGGYEVFSCAEDARHEVRFFEDEEAAYFYLFGVLAAEALRNGRLKPTRK
jgi:hypothetical protein